MVTDLKLAPDASHHQGHITTWSAILSPSYVSGAWCKATQGSTFTDPEAASNLRAFRAAKTGGLIDWYGAYLWPDLSAPVKQKDRYMSVISPYAADPAFRWTIDCEGGSVFDLDELARLLTEELGAERGGVYGGSFLIGPLHDPFPPHAPHAGALNTFFRAAYIDDRPGTGRNVTPHLFASVGPDWWQYTNGISGPLDRDRFPRTLPGGWHGDISCFWEPTARQTYAQWLEKTTPGGGQGGGDGMLDPKDPKDRAAFKLLLDEYLGTPSEAYWVRFLIGVGDGAIAGREDRRKTDQNPTGLAEPYGSGFDFAKSKGGGGALPPELTAFVNAFQVKA